MIRSLQDVLPEHLHDYGGKAVNLAKLHQLGVPVPKGIVVPTQEFIRFLNQCQHLDTLKILHQEENDVEAILETAENFYHDASQFEIPPDVAREVSQGLAHLQGNESVQERSYAVRSSATVEDTAQFSFAGQAETFLCVSDIPSILNAIKDTWLSLFSPRSLLYLQGKGIPLRQVRMGVIIQEMVLGDISGVMFTANVSTGDTDQIVIDATWGLGESLVAGKVTPDHFVLQKTPLSVLHRHLGTKAVSSAPAPKDQPTCTVLLETPEEKRNSYCLTENQLLELARLGLHIEKHFEAPQDIEWTYKQGRIVVLQTRPITAI
jgi:pyruvate,water dikinase